MNESYQSARSAASSIVVGVLKSFGLVEALRGSWAFGDFHLLADHRTSYSDLDLTVPFIQDSERMALSKDVLGSLRKHINVPVSISYFAAS